MGRHKLPEGIAKEKTLPIQDVPIDVVRFLKDIKHDLGVPKIWDVIAHYLKPKFKEDLEEYLIYKGVKTKESENGSDTRGGVKEESSTQSEELSSEAPVPLYERR